MSGRPHRTVTIVCARLAAAGTQSARRFDELPARLGDVERHVAARDGWTITSDADEFTLAFTSAVAGLRCVLDIHDDLGSDLPLGIGVHAGEAGPDHSVLRSGAAAGAAAIAACAASGETLASTLVRELAGDTDPEICFGELREFEPGQADGVRGAHDVTRAAPGSVAPIRVVIADDSAIVRDGLAAVLTAAGLTVAAVAGDPEALLTAVNGTHPDIAIVDIRMPPTYTNEGLLAAERIRAENPHVGILVLSTHAEPMLAVRLLDAAPDGRVGYLLKDRVSDVATLIEALGRINAGETVIDPEVSGRMIQRRARHSDLDELTPRELEVLRLLAEGRSNRAIAEALVVTPKTLEGHIGRIFLKLGLREAADEHRRVAAVLAYLRPTG
jgi:DNA-binding NarL/FixJ family response regulator